MSSSFSPYADQHKNPQGPGDARPTAIQIIEDNKLIQAWSDKVVLITGASAGIGIETTKAIYATGAQVFVVVRDTAKVQPIIADIISSTKGSGKIEVIEADLDSLESVKNAARRFLSLSSQLNVLINNAGIMACPKTITIDGFERQFAVNYLAHFTLTAMLLPTLRNSSTAAFNSRTIWVTSAAHRGPESELNLDDIGILDHYERWAAYGQSKTAMIWASNYIDRTYGAQGVHSLAVHPGGIFTNLGQYLTEEEIQGFAAISETKKVIKTPAQGAATQVWAATAPIWEGKGGKYLENVQVAEPATKFSPLEDGHGAHVYKPAKEDGLWTVSLKLANLENP